MKQWTDRIRLVKTSLVVAAVVVVIGSLVVSHWLVNDLSREEQRRMTVWAEALRSLNKADEHMDLTLVLRVLEENHTIPVVVIDQAGQVADYLNVEVTGSTHGDSLRSLQQTAQRMQRHHRPIRIENRERGHYQLVCYGDSVMLQRLSAWPYIQLVIVALLMVVALMALLMQHRAEQNKVWVGLSKETAHQLGTPISSMMAWVEMLREQYPDEPLIDEMRSDVGRLERIAERFSKIGSVPALKPEPLNPLLHRVGNYMRQRAPQTIVFCYAMPDHDVWASVNVSLFEWVIENLCKNAVDAMEGTGTLTIALAEANHRIEIDITDTGKGIRRKDIKHVFTPGFTTKQRGWGLGLSLARRIVTDYHGGRISVAHTAINQGTTFRIVLGKPTTTSLN